MEDDGDDWLQWDVNGVPNWTLREIVESALVYQHELHEVMWLFGGDGECHDIVERLHTWADHVRPDWRDQKMCVVDVLAREDWQWRNDVDVVKILQKLVDEGWGDSSHEIPFDFARLEEIAETFGIPTTETIQLALDTCYFENDTEFREDAMEWALAKTENVDGRQFVELIFGKLVDSFRGHVTEGISVDEGVYLSLVEFIKSAARRVAHGDETTFDTTRRVWNLPSDEMQTKVENLEETLHECCDYREFSCKAVMNVSSLFASECFSHHLLFSHVHSVREVFDWIAETTGTHTARRLLGKHAESDSTDDDGRWCVAAWLVKDVIELHAILPPHIRPEVHLHDVAEMIDRGDDDNDDAYIGRILAKKRGLNAQLSAYDKKRKLVKRRWADVRSIVRARPVALYLQRLAVERRWRLGGPAAAYQAAVVGGDADRKRTAFDEVTAELFTREVRRRLGDDTIAEIKATCTQRAAELLDA